MVVGEAVLETVFSPAFLAVYARDKWCVDQSLTRRFRALLFVGEDAGLRREGYSRGRALVRLCFPACPFAGFGACVCGFSAVVAAI